LFFFFSFSFFCLAGRSSRGRIQNRPIQINCGSRRSKRRRRRRGRRSRRGRGRRGREGESLEGGKEPGQEGLELCLVGLVHVGPQQQPHPLRYPTAHTETRKRQEKKTTTTHRDDMHDIYIMS
jgi:hypothetical protein